MPKPRPTTPPSGDRPATEGRRTTPASLLTLSLVALLSVYAAAMLVLQPSSSGTHLPLSTVLRMADENSVSAVRFLDEDARVTGTTTGDEGPRRFWTSYPRSDAATNDLLKTFLTHETRVSIDAQGGKAVIRFVAQFLLPLVILANLFALLFFATRAVGGGADGVVGFSRLGNRRLAEKDKTHTTFADLAAAEEAIVELAEVRDYLADATLFAKMGAVPPKGVLIVGPPGCGKTLLARAVAGEARAAFFSISGSEFVESLVGVGAARVRDLFRQARESAPAILFIDELDSVGRQRGAGLGGGHDEREQTLNELLVQMDGFSPSEGVVVLAATNRPDILDPALLRPGRFDRQITVDQPDVQGRLEILQLHAKGKRLADADRDLPVMARRTPGFTGADLAAVLNEAALLAVRERAAVIGRTQLEEAVERVVSGPRRKGALMGPEDKRRVAVHEAGHALVATAMGHAGEIEKVSVIARGRGIGHMALLSEHQLLPTRTEMEAQVAIAMAGVAAEELLFGEPSTGSESDLARATNTARDMAGRFGMSPRLGRVRVLHDQREVFLGRDYLITRDVSQPTLEHLDAEVRRILDEEEAKATSILVAQRAVLDRLVDALVSQETLQGTDLSDLLSAVPRYVKAARNGTRTAPARVRSKAGAQDSDDAP